MTKGANSILLITHTQYRDNKPVPGPMDSLLEYFLPITSRVTYVQHSIYKGNGSKTSFYQKGNLITTNITSFHANTLSPVRYLADLIITLKELSFKNKHQIVVAADPLNFFYGYLLKKIGKVKKTYFYTLDYSPQRFESRLMNSIYHALDQFAVNNCDYSISACKKICDVRSKQGLKKQKNFYLPNSPLLEGVAVKEIGKINKHELVMVFSDPAQIDFQIIFKSIRELSRTYRDIGLKLIGRGNFKSKLISRAKKLRVLSRIKFLDTPNHKATLEEISRSAIGLECNNDTVAWNAYREPLKIREYFSLGLPVISKPGHALVDEIKHEKVGYIINNVEELNAAIKFFFDHPQKYDSIRSRVLKHSKKFDKNKKIKQIFKW